MCKLKALIRMNLKSISLSFRWLAAVHPKYQVIDSCWGSGEQLSSDVDWYGSKRDEIKCRYVTIG
jgi:hypothetical protein